MKVARETSEQLVLEYVPWFLAIMLTGFTLTFVAVGLAITLSGEWTGLIFLIIGGGLGAIALVVFVERLQVILNRNSGRIRVRRQTLRGYSEDTYDLSDLQSAVVESSSNSEGTTTYRPVLVLTSAGKDITIPITQIYASGNGASKTADAINTWLSA